MLKLSLKEFKCLSFSKKQIILTVSWKNPKEWLVWVERRGTGYAAAQFSTDSSYPFERCLGKKLIIYMQLCGGDCVLGQICLVGEETEEEGRDRRIRVESTGTA